MGVEIDPEAAARARGTGARVVVGDFFDFAPGAGRFDAVVGNPPFIRYQRLEPEARRRALGAARAVGVPLPGDANAWAAFVAVAASLVEADGRLAMVIPREGTAVDYARPLWSWLRAQFGRVTVTPVGDLAFEGALQRVALLQADREGRPRRERPHEADQVLGDALRRGDLVPLSDVAELRLGVVTGDRRFFVRPRGSFPAGWSVPVLRTPGAIAGPVLDSVGEELLAIPRGARLPPDVAAIVEEGRGLGLDRRTKCRCREPWYSVILGPRPDAFLGYLVKRRPRIAVNAAGAWSTNNVHRLLARRPGALVAAMHHPATLLSIERLGRTYGGGVLKIEPGDGPRILVPARERWRGEPLLGELDESGAARYVGLPAEPYSRLYRALRDARAREFATTAP